MKKKLVTEMGRMGREEFAGAEKLPLTVVVDNVRSLHNVGSVFRTSDAFRVERVLLCTLSTTTVSGSFSAPTNSSRPMRPISVTSFFFIGPPLVR